jgi:uncharacterized membrane protein
VVSNIPKVLDQLVVNGIIKADQKEEVLKMCESWKATMQSTQYYKMMIDPFMKSIPEYMRQMTPEITFEDSMYLTWAVHQSNMKRLGTSF